MSGSVEESSLLEAYKHIGDSVSGIGYTKNPKVRTKEQYPMRIMLILKLSTPRSVALSKARCAMGDLKVVKVRTTKGAKPVPALVMNTSLTPAECSTLVAKISTNKDIRNIPL